MTDAPEEIDEDPPEREEPPWPWSFILLVVAGGLYLVFRFVELAIKLIR